MHPKIYTVSDHDIDAKLVDADALFVLHKLREAGFTAYLVGGGVRDLLLKRVPKDFDISTSALPEEVKQLFQRRCILIGRRFRLAHVRFGRKILEVSTFRSGESEDNLIVHDNEWGSPEEDALRRDFTVNGLFYNPEDHSIIDYVGGWEDIHKNILRTIGDPEVRFKQDPVRMIRLLKFRARFGFNITPDARKALIDCRAEILKSSQARVLEEVLRMLESGASAPFFSLLAEAGLLPLLYPSLHQFLKAPIGKELLMYLSAADKVNQTLGKNPLDRSILMTCMLFPMIKQRLQAQYIDQGRIPHLGELITLTSGVVREFTAASFTVFPRRLTAIMSSIITTQFRLTPLSGKTHHHPKVFRHKDFPDALAFLKIRALVNKELIDAYSSWKSAYKQFSRHGEPRKSHSHPQSPIRIHETKDSHHVVA